MTPFRALRSHVAEAQGLLGEDGQIPSSGDLDAASGHLADALTLLDEELPGVIRAALRQAWERGVADAEDAAEFVQEFLVGLAEAEVAL